MNKFLRTMIALIVIIPLAFFSAGWWDQFSRSAPNDAAKIAIYLGMCLAIVFAGIVSINLAWWLLSLLNLPATERTGVLAAKQKQFH